MGKDNFKTSLELALLYVKIYAISLILFVLIMLFLTLPFKWLWNLIMPHLGISSISYWKAFLVLNIWNFIIKAIEFVTNKKWEDKKIRKDKKTNTIYINGDI